MFLPAISSEIHCHFQAKVGPVEVHFSHTAEKTCVIVTILGANSFMANTEGMGGQNHDRRKHELL